MRGSCSLHTVLEKIKLITNEDSQVELEVLV